MYLDSFDLHNNEFKVGRSQRCDVVIERMNINQNIKNIFSKEHFVIYKDPDNALAFIRDLSKSGTYLNGHLIGKNNTNVLQNDDVIAVGLNKRKVFVYKCMYSQDMNYLPFELKQKYEPSTLLGRGAAGEVRLALEKFTCKMVAIKKIMKSRSTLSQIHKLTHPSKIKTEISILQTLKHPCVINMEDIVETPEEVYIVLDYMKGGELTNRILSNTPLSESNVKFLFYQMVLAVQFLHGKGITHRDLKPENVLLFSEEIETLVKVSDFGLSKVTEGDDMMTTICGTMNYIAPEILDNRIPEYNKQVDVWSLGVILFYMLSKRLPFQSSDRTVHQKLIISGCYMMEKESWDGISASAKDLVEKMLNVKPQKRICIQDVLKHSWLESDLVMKLNVHSLLESHVGIKDSSEDTIFTYGMEPPLKRIRLLSSDEETVL
nr:ovarian-specific serine/threonine-protein kinase Lok-like [Leptinotarsa decemlineata]